MSGFPNAAFRLLVGLGLAGLLAACGADHDLDCLKSNGSPVVQRRAIARRLLQVVVHDNVDVTIVPDTASYAEVRAGENVINDIEFSSPAGAQQLVIRNTSRCNWARSYDTPREVRLHLPYLRELVQQGYGLLSTASQLRQDTLFLRTLTAGDVNMDVNVTYLFVDVYDAGDLTLHGFAHDFHPNLGSNGFLLAGGLLSDYCYFRTYPTWIGDAHVQARLALGGYMYGKGRLFYAGQPPYTDIQGPNAGNARKE